MTNEASRFSIDDLKKCLKISIEPDIRLSNEEISFLDQCLSQFSKICHRPLILHCTLSSFNAHSNGVNVDRESIRLNQYLRVRQPRKYFWMRNIQTMSLHLRLPTTLDADLTAHLIEFHSCKRVPHSSRMIVEQKKPILFVYSIEDHSLKLNIRGENSLLQLVFFASEQIESKDGSQGIYYKWSDEGQIRSTTIQFQIHYSIEENP